MLPPATTLRTRRLELRPFGPGDAPAIAAYAGDPRFFRFLPGRGPATAYTLADAQAHLEELLRLAGQGYPGWLVLLGGEAVGAVRFRPGERFPELGYGVAPARWGQGIASEAVAAVMDWAAPRAQALEARCDPRNLASVRVLARAGFVPDGGPGRFTWRPRQFHPTSSQAHPPATDGPRP